MLHPKYPPTPQNQIWLPKGEWLEKHQILINKTIKYKDSKVIFLGDSITEAWLYEGKVYWNKEFNKYKPLNLGIGGDEIQHLHWRLLNGEGDNTNPNVVVVLIGTNNIGNAGHSGEITIELYSDLLDHIKTKWPRAHILVHTIFPRDRSPRSPFRIEIETVNEALRSWSKEGKFYLLDLYEKFMELDGKISDKIMPDFLHLSKLGYKKWVKNLKPSIEALL